MKWEVRCVVQPDWGLLLEELEKRGLQGWELVQVHEDTCISDTFPGEDCFCAMMKRPIIEKVELSVAADMLENRGMVGAAEVIRQEFGLGKG